MVQTQEYNSSKGLKNLGILHIHLFKRDNGLSQVKLLGIL